MQPADFRVRLRGRNFLLADGDRIGRYAFDVTVFVHARDPDEARENAVRALADDEDLRSALRNPHDDPPLVYTLESVAIPRDIAPPPKRSAFVFRPDDGTEPEPGLPEEPRTPR
ncbi:MAG TPA: hypothetical protein VK081_13810 [Planctomycetota bacterium]|nr:hypothetical protein [Planctomycetota bacterium]